MPSPTFGREQIKRRERRKELAQEAPQPEVLGVVKPELTNPKPHIETVSWSGSSGNVDMTEPPPPWEVGLAEYAESDARRVVDVPSNWALYWMNPKLLDSAGWRYWQAVTISNPSVKCKVPQMVSPDGTIRRGGGTTGDILCWMYQTWRDSLRKRHIEETAARTQSAVDKQQQLREEFARGTYGPGVRLEESRHPTHTMIEGKSIKD